MSQGKPKSKESGKADSEAARKVSSGARPAKPPGSAKPPENEVEAKKPAKAEGKRQEKEEEAQVKDKDTVDLAPFDDEDAPLDTNVVADTSERTILVVDEAGQRRSETVAIISKILPNAAIETANDPEEALSMMNECDFDTYVVNFLMPGYSSSPFVKSVVNHPDHPLLVGFAADKMSDAVDPKKGLKIIPLKRLFDLNADNSSGDSDGEGDED